MTNLHKSFTTGSNDPVVSDSSNSFDAIDLYMSRQVVSIESELNQIQQELISIGSPVSYDVVGLNEPAAQAFLALHEVETPSLENLVSSLRNVLDYIAGSIGRVTRMTNNLFLTGMPFINGMLEKAKSIKETAKLSSTETAYEINNSKLKKTLFIGNEVLQASQVVDKVDVLAGISSQVLSKDKLGKFKELSDDVLEPFRSSIKSKKTDQVVFIYGILAAITNPAIPVGSIFKQLFAIASPNMGKAVDAATTVSGFAISGGLGTLKFVIPTLGLQAGNVVSDWSKGRMDVTRLPNYSDIYPFCDIVSKKSDNSFYNHKSSETLIGNYVWQVTEFKPVIGGNMTASVHSVGSKFKHLKTKGDIEGELTPLSKNDVVRITELVTEMLLDAKAYSLSFSKQSDTYEKQYKQITDIVMGYDSGTKRDEFMRMSYRNALNGLLGGVWKNSFGSDTQFIRYLLTTCKSLLRYCESSIVASNQNHAMMYNHSM